MTKILITGAAGSIGGELYRQLAPYNTVFAFDIDETRLFDLHEEHRQKGYDVDYMIGDVVDRRAVDDVVYDFRPDVIYHVAALKHVTPHEKDARAAVQTNVIGTLNVVDAARRSKVNKFVFVSTDKAVNQHCVMGTTKRLGELIVRNAGYVAVRFGNVMGSRGSVFEIWERQFAKGEPLTITDKRMKRYVMTIPQACELLIEAKDVGKPGDLLILDMGEPVAILDIVAEFLKQKGVDYHPFKIIGARPGEALFESLMTKDEEKRVIKRGNFYVIEHEKNN